MSDQDDLDRISKILTDGWQDEEHAVVILDDAQQVSVGERLMAFIWSKFEPDVHFVLDIPTRSTYLEADGTVILETNGYFVTRGD